MKYMPKRPKVQSAAEARGLYLSASAITAWLMFCIQGYCHSPRMIVPAAVMTSATQRGQATFGFSAFVSDVAADGAAALAADGADRDAGVSLAAGARSVIYISTVTRR